MRGCSQTSSKHIDWNQSMRWPAEGRSSSRKTARWFGAPTASRARPSSCSSRPTVAKRGPRRGAPRLLVYRPETWGRKNMVAGSTFNNLEEKQVPAPDTTPLRPYGLAGTPCCKIPKVFPGCSSLTQPLRARSSVHQAWIPGKRAVVVSQSGTQRSYQRTRLRLRA